MDHASADRRARLVAGVCCARAMDRELIQRDLAVQGLGLTEGEVAVELVVTAFGWALLRRMGVERFPSVFVLQVPDGRETTLRVAQAHLFTAALAVAEEIFVDGYTSAISKEGVAAIVQDSSEAGAVSQALDADPELDLSAVNLKTSFFGFSLDEFRSGAGYRREPGG